jgi:DNA-binding NtrC family response regulator
MEADIILLVIDKYDGQITEFARRLGIGRSTLCRKVAEFGIDVKR